MKTFQQFKEAAIAVPLIGAGAKTLLKIGGAYAAAKGGEKILKDLLGTPDRPKDTDWVNNPKDRTDDELNVRSNQVKDAEKFSDFDKEMAAIKKALDAGNITKKEAAKRRLQAGKDRPKN